MKELLIAILFMMGLILPTSLQNDFTYDITVRGKKGEAVQGLKVWIYNGETGESITKNTNASGQVSFIFPPGIWTLNLPGMLKYREFVVREGYRGKGTMTINYIPDVLKEEKELKEKRAAILPDTLKAYETPCNIFKRGHTNFTVVLRNSKQLPVRDIPVGLFSIKRKVIYQNRTNTRGEACFIVPVGEKYIVDVDDIKNFNISENIGYEGRYKLTMDYEPARIFEMVRNDSVWQEEKNLFQPYETHAHVNLTIHNGRGEIMEDEDVFLSQIIGDKVYIASTDHNGKADFLLPKGDKYMIGFRYQRDVDVIDLLQARGMVTLSGIVTYIPDPGLEHPEYFIPTPGELLIEEFDNFITKQLPLPKDSAIALYTKWGNDSISNSSKEAILELGIAVTENQSYKDISPPANLAFVLDKSGSMAGYRRIESVKESLIQYIQNLRPQDRITLISFSDHPFIEIPFEALKNKQHITEVINSITPTGGTNIYSGLLKGFEQLSLHYNPENTNHLILLSDGFGTTEPKSIIDTTNYYLDQGIGLSAVGVGYHYNYSLMSLLTARGGGFFQHAGESQEIYDEFNHVLNRLIYPVARDAKIELIYNDEIVFNHIFGYDVSSHDGNKVVIEAGHLYAGQNKIALVQFDLHHANQLIESKPVKLIISYFDLLKKEEVTLESDLSLSWQPYTGNQKLIVENHQKKLYAIAIMNQSLKVMSDAFEKDDIKEAIYRVERTIAQINELFPDAMDADVERLAAKLTKYSKSLHQLALNKGIRI